MRKDPMETLPLFFRAVEKRLRDGDREYAGASFTRDPADLCSEVQEELADVCGWSFILWCRLNQIRALLETLDPEKGVEFNQDDVHRFQNYIKDLESKLNIGDSG